ncbi:MAG: four helix bundle protein [Sulfuritalea sp.]|nr:four helix bundle protein [Sulfuritalea sp.]
MKRGHRELRAWQEAMTLVELVYAITSNFPREEQFGLTSQMRRAAVSVPANIAEGAARNGTKELLHFLGIASGSLSELDTHLELSLRLKFVTEASNVQDKIDQVSALTMALSKSLREKL